MRVCALLIILLLSGSTQAGIYYVDYAGGSDSNAGTSSGVAWQHCPGDANATANANITLSAGDTVYFKRGVTYVGMVTSVSGSSGSPITYTTNSSFGSGIAVWDAGTNLVMLTSGTPLRADWNTVSGIL